MSVAVKLDRPKATLADLEALPEHMKGELIDGVLYAMTRPRGRHQSVAGRITSDYEPPLQRGRGGPGGWWILPEPGIELPRAPEVSPDIAGWRRSRMPELPREKSITLVPDWVCEVLSPTTRRHNLLVKSRYYASVGVPWLWFVDSDSMLVTVLRLQEGNWLQVGVFAEETEARLPPFDEVPVSVLSWWPEEPPAPSTPSTP